MNHDEIKDKILALFDGDLTNEEASAVRAHLDTCVPCQQDLETWKSVSRRIFSGVSLPPSEAFVHRVMRRIGQEEDRPVPAGWGAFRRWLAPTFALAAAAGLLLFTLPRTPSGVDTEDLIFAANPGEANGTAESVDVWDLLQVNGGELQ